MSDTYKTDSPNIGIRLSKPQPAPQRRLRRYATTSGERSTGIDDRRARLEVLCSILTAGLDTLRAE